MFMVGGVLLLYKGFRPVSYLRATKRENDSSKGICSVDLSTDMFPDTIDPYIDWLGRENVMGR